MRVGVGGRGFGCGLVWCWRRASLEQVPVCLCRRMMRRCDHYHYAILERIGAVVSVLGS